MLRLWGREPVSVIFCANFLVELVVFVLFLSYFLRLNTVYEYCIDTYGLSFVELYNSMHSLITEGKIEYGGHSASVEQGSRRGICGWISVFFTYF